MDKRLSLADVSLRQLNRDPAGVVERVLRGERLILLRHKKPVATIQPIDGFVGQPLLKRETSIDGSELGDVGEEADRLTDIERDLLVGGVGMNKIHPVWVSTDLSETVETLESMRLRGLVRRSSIGWVLRGRGMMLREVLLERAGLVEEDTWRIRGLGRRPL